MDGLKTLIHFHSNYSYDSNISLESLVAFAERENFGCLALTDHDNLEGALRLREMTSMKVIVGEEITTRDGDVIGLFLEEFIRPGMSARDTALAIREQGGLVLLPHPFTRAFGVGVGAKAFDMLDLIDAVEVNNGQHVTSGPDRKARRFAKSFDFAQFVGADSHMTHSIAPCYQIMRDFDGPADFVDALRSATLHPGRHPFSYFAATAYRIACQQLGLTLPGGYGIRSKSASVEVSAPAATSQAALQPVRA